MNEENERVLMMEKHRLMALFDAVNSFDADEWEVIFQELRQEMTAMVEQLHETDDVQQMEKMSQDYLDEVKMVTEVLHDEVCAKKLTAEQYASFVEVIHEMALSLLELENQSYSDHLSIEQLITINQIVLQSLDQLYKLEIIHHKEVLCQQLFVCWRHFRYVLHRVNVLDQSIDQQTKEKVRKQADHFMVLLDLAENNCRKYHQSEVEELEAQLQSKMKFIQHFHWLTPVYKRSIQHVKYEMFALEHPLFAHIIDEEG